MKQQSNPVGLTGFILTLVALVVTFIPVLQYANMVLVPLALLCCLIGLFKKSRAFAVIGLIIHLILIGLVATCVGGLAAIASAS